MITREQSKRVNSLNTLVKTNKEQQFRGRP